jgi:hypothetical protein
MLGFNCNLNDCKNEVRIIIFLKKKIEAHICFLQKKLF